MKAKILMIAMMLGTASLVGCSAKAADKESVPVIDENNIPSDNANLDDVLPEEDETPAAPASDETIPEDANAKIDPSLAVKKDIEKITSIELFDLEGNKLERTFTDEEIEAIIKDYNESEIQDTSYIMMIAGNIMVVTLEDGSTINFSSYGNPDFVIAATESGDSYHLNASVIGNILLN